MRAPCCPTVGSTIRHATSPVTASRMTTRLRAPKLARTLPGRRAGASCRLGGRLWIEFRANGLSATAPGVAAIFDRAPADTPSSAACARADHSQVTLPDGSMAWMTSSVGRAWGGAPGGRGGAYRTGRRAGEDDERVAVREALEVVVDLGGARPRGVLPHDAPGPVHLDEPAPAGVGLVVQDRQDAAVREGFGELADVPSGKRARPGVQNRPRHVADADLLVLRGVVCLVVRDLDVQPRIGGLRLVDRDPGGIHARLGYGQERERRQGAKHGKARGAPWRLPRARRRVRARRRDPRSTRPAHFFPAGRPPESTRQSPPRPRGWPRMDPRLVAREARQMLVGCSTALVLAPLLSAGAGPASEPAATVPNILIVMADDLGVDSLASYAEGQDFPVTPTLDSLAQGGVLFRNAWSNPKCSPTRAAILTGRYAFRTGVGDVVTLGGLRAVLLRDDHAGDARRGRVVVRPRLLREVAPGGPEPTPRFRTCPGSRTNDGCLRGALEPPPVSYYRWPRTVNGTRIHQHDLRHHGHRRLGPGVDPGADEPVVLLRVVQRAARALPQAAGGAVLGGPDRPRPDPATASLSTRRTSRRWMRSSAGS